MFDLSIMIVAENNRMINIDIADLNVSSDLKRNIEAIDV
jgi:hypothetical protein